MKLKRLSSDEFDRLVAMTRFQDNSRAILRAVLVDGRPQADVATEFGVSKQRVNRLMNFIKEDYIEKAAAGTALVSVTMEMPENLAIDLAAMLDVLASCQDETMCGMAIEKVRNALRKVARSLTGDQES